jgi:hypothetical protein
VLQSCFVKFEGGLVANLSIGRLVVVDGGAGLVG